MTVQVDFRALVSYLLFGWRAFSRELARWFVQGVGSVRPSGLGHSIG